MPATRSLALPLSCWAIALGAGCATTGGQTADTPMRLTKVDATPAIVLLQEAKFDEALLKAAEIITADPANAEAHAVAAVVSFKRTMHQLTMDMRTVAMSVAQGSVNHRYARFALEEAEKGLKVVDDELAAAATDPDLELKLCLACWQYDWNHNGEVDWRDEALFQVEVDRDGNPIDEGDPRRKPTFRFDAGDVRWARALLSFERAALNVLLAYRWSDLDQIFTDLRRTSPDQVVVTIGMDDKSRVTHAKALLLFGFAEAQAARVSYLAERDDDREWVPNPKQQNHPLPLPVDDKLYETWAAVLGDLTRLVEGHEGLSVSELAQLGDHQWQPPPRGFIDVGKLFDAPGDLVLKGATLKDLVDTNPDNPQPIENALREVLGDKYVTAMPATPLISRLARMKKEVDRGEDSFERKLRYLFWLN